MKHAGCFVIGVISLMLTGCDHLTELEIHGPSSRKLDIVLVPSHYYGPNADDNARWIADAETLRRRFLEQRFWARYRERINFYRLDVSTPDDFHVAGGYWIPDNERIKAFALAEAPLLDFDQNDQIIYVIESESYENDPLRTPEISPTRGDPHITRLEMSHIGAFIHEFGHSFGLLGDEYPKLAEDGWVSDNPNVATDHPGNRCEDLWPDLMGVVVDAPGTWIQAYRQLRTVGCHQSNDPNSEGRLYAPTQSACIMNQGNDQFPFCPVCQRRLVTLLERYSSPVRCGASPREFHDRAAFAEAAAPLIFVNFDARPDNQVIRAPGRGLLAGELLASMGIRFTSGVILEGPNPASGGFSPPNIIGNSPINEPERAPIAASISVPCCAVGVTNIGAEAVLRAFDAAFRLIGQVFSDPDPETKDFIGLTSPVPIYRFEFDSVSGAEFGADDLLIGTRLIPADLTVAVLPKNDRPLDPVKIKRP